MPNKRRERSYPGGQMAASVPARRESAAKIIYRELQDDIVSLRRKPREIINEKELAAHFGVSRTPVHEAVLRLADEGLVDVFPQSGTFVSRIPIRALYEAILIRKALEETTVRLASHRAEPVHIAALEQNLHETEAARVDGDWERFHLADTAFHHQISQIAGFDGIWTAIQQVKAHIDRYRRLTLPQQGRLERVIVEHGAILDGVRRGDVPAAVGAMASHLGQMLQEIHDAGSLNPDYFLLEEGLVLASVEIEPLSEAVAACS